MSVIQLDVAKGLILFHLAGFKGFPRDDAGLQTFARALCDCCVSVGHAEHVLRAMDLNFPTIRDIRSAADECREQFAPRASQRLEWEKTYGKPDLEFVRGLVGQVAALPRRSPAEHAADLRAGLWASVRDCLYYAEGPGCGPVAVGFWADALKRHIGSHGGAVDTLRRQLLKYGWPALMDAAPNVIAELSAGSEFAPMLPRGINVFRRVTVPVVTQADIDQAERAYRDSQAAGELAE